MIEKVVGSLLSRLSSWRRHRATRDRISGGNLLTGCSRFRKESRSLRTSCALVSRLPICGIHRHETPCCRDGSGKVNVITSGSNEAAETTGKRRVSRSLAHSNLSFSFNMRRRSWIERSRAASRAMLAAVNVWGSGVNRRRINLAPVDVRVHASPAMPDGT